MSLSSAFFDLRHTSSALGGYDEPLRDYIKEENEDDGLNPFFCDLNAISDDLMICTDLPVKINRKSVSNQIIRYKDAFKLVDGAIRVPYVIYWKDSDSEKAVLLSDSDYIEAKGMYYCLTDQGSPLGEYRNDMLCMCLRKDTSDDVLKSISDFHQGSKAAGAIQRQYDHRYLKNVDDMKEMCVSMAQKTWDDAIAVLPDLQEKGSIINNAIGRVFLLKKAIYVQYMSSRELLNTRHEGNVKMQRQFAKAYCDEVPIVSMSSLWRLNSSEQIS